MEYYIYRGEDELIHWGIKGMKWGIRRYQNKDGSLTAAGKKRRAADGDSKSKSSKTSAKPVSKSRPKSNTKSSSKTTKTVKKPVPEKPKQKSVSEMTDAEVRDRINRMMLEKQYYDTRRSLAASNPQQVSKGKKFMDSVLNDVVAPAAKEAGRKWLTNFMEDKLGLNKKTELQRLEDTWKKLDYKKKISDLKKGIEDNDDPYGVKSAEARAKKAKADYEYVDYDNKRANVGKNETKDVNWESKNKEGQYYRDAFKTERARRDYMTYLEEKESLGDEEAWKRYVKKQGGN